MKEDTDETGEGGTSIRNRDENEKVGEGGGLGGGGAGEGGLGEGGGGDRLG